MVKVELVGRTLQHALNLLAERVPQWIQAHVPPVWFDRYSRLIDEYRLPQKPDDLRDVLMYRVPPWPHSRVR